MCQATHCALCIQADDDVISDVFHGHNMQTPAELRGISGEVHAHSRTVPHAQSQTIVGLVLPPSLCVCVCVRQVAVRKFDQTVCEILKKRNKLQHARRSREQTLAKLSAQLEAMQGEREAIESAPAGDSEAASQLRQMENRLDKVVVKCSEASHIRKTYETILEKLQEVSACQPGPGLPAASVWYTLHTSLSV